MAETDINNIIANTLRQVLNNPQLKVTPESLLIEDLGLESIDFLDLTSELENSIGMEVDFREVIKYMKTQNTADNIDIKSLRVKNLAAFIESKKS